MKELGLTPLEAGGPGQKLNRPLLEAHALAFRLFVQVLVQGGSNARKVFPAVALRLTRLGHLHNGTASGIFPSTTNRARGATNTQPFYSRETAL